jgi:hypothetical protein
MTTMRSLARVVLRTAGCCAESGPATALVRVARPSKQRR